MAGIDWKKVKHVHLIGIGGIGISALARLLFHMGKEISGTEDNESPETLNELRANGVKISLDLDPKSLPKADVYVYSDAWLTKHPDVVSEAQARSAPALSFYDAMGQLASSYKLIAVAGAHGKTTTTAMLIDLLEAGGLDPMAWVGSLRAKTKSNFRAGKGDYFVSEADEYRRHFLYFTPHILVITNIDADHLDYYKDIKDIQSAFRELAQKIPKNGYVVCDPNSPTVKPVVKDLACTVVDYKKFFDPKLPLKVLSLHRVNAAAVLAVADILKISPEVARKSLAEFAGTWRRFEYKGKTRNGAEVYDDYGHHPTEIKTTLGSVREQFPDKRIVVAFHPHLYSRTKALMEDFATAFDDADDIVIAPIFAAREAPDPTVTSEILAQKIKAHGKQAQALDSFHEIEKYLEEYARTGDLVVTMGAGDIYKVGEALTK
jgi:UDP-N-acetylmuramate--alanine ligase